MTGPLCFPTPLPDETIYSLFCRYHVRSCNASDNATVKQLFGRRCSMHTTVLSAFPLKYASHWMETFHGFSIESLIQENTALPLFQAFSQRTNTSCHSYASDRFFMSMYNKCCTPAKKMRYCPKCAQAQWETFGVSYWQVLPQINGYEICLIHHTPIIETKISHTDIRYRFFPATNVLNHHLDLDKQEETSRLKEIQKHYKRYFQMASDINYLYRSSYPSFSLYEKVHKAFIYDLPPVRCGWLDRVLDDPVLYQCINQSYIWFLYALNEEDETDRIFWEFQSLPICLQIILCRAMFGSIQNICSLH